MLFLVNGLPEPCGDSRVWRRRFNLGEAQRREVKEGRCVLSLANGLGWDCGLLTSLLPREPWVSRRILLVEPPSNLCCSLMQSLDNNVSMLKYHSRTQIMGYHIVTRFVTQYHTLSSIVLGLRSYLRNRML